MKIYVNNELVSLPDEISNVEQLVLSGRYGKGAVAVALNDKIVRRSDWSATNLREMDRVMIINAAFGG